MSNQTETSSSDEPDPDSATRHRWHLLARLWDSGIPLWQRLLVWAGAASLACMTFFFLYQDSIPLGLFFAPGPLPPIPDSTIWLWQATSLALSAGLWLWPLTRGRWRIVTLVLAMPATLAVLMLFAFLFRLGVHTGGDFLGSVAQGLFWIPPGLAGAAVTIIWVRAIRDWRASRRT